MTIKKFFSAFLTLFLLATLSGCGGDDSDNASVRILNASIDYGAVDIYFDGELKHTNVAAGEMSGYLEYKAESNTIKITRTGSQAAVYETTAAPGKGTKHVYVVYGGDGNLRMNQYSENESQAGADKTKVRIINASPDSGLLDFFASTSATEVNDLIARVAGIGYGSATSWLEIDKGTYRAWFTVAGDKTDQRLHIPSVVLEDRKLLTIVLLPTTGGALVNAVNFNQESDLKKTNNTNARLRLVAGLTSGERIAIKNAQNEQLLSNASPSVSSYILVPQGTTSLTVTANAANLTTLNADLVAGSDNTIFAYGATSGGALGSTKAVLFRDNNRAPSQSTRAKLRLANGFVESATGLTASADFLPIVSNVALGTASDYGLFSGGTYSRLDVTEATGGAPIYLTTDVTLPSGSVYSLFVMGSRAAPVGILRKDR